MSTPEGKVKARVNARLKPGVDAGHIWKLMPVQRGFGVQALDYHLCVIGYHIVIETKAGKEQLTALQNVTKGQIEQAGGMVFVVRDEDTLNQTMAVIDNLIRQRNPKWGTTT